jgi:hypothetical protein
MVAGGMNSTSVSSFSEGSESLVETGGRVGEGGKGTEIATSVALRSLGWSGRGSGCFRLSATLVAATAPVRDGLLESALDGGRVDLDKSILEGGRALEVARIRFCGGAADAPLVRLGLTILVWDRDRVDDGFEDSDSFLDRSATEGGLEGFLELGWKGMVDVTPVAARLLGLSGTEDVCTGTFGLGGGISWGGGAGTIVILLGPVCILGTSPGAGMVPGWTRAMPPFRGGG